MLKRLYILSGQMKMKNMHFCSFQNFPFLFSFRLEEEKHFVGSISVKSYRVNNYEPVSIHAGFYRFADMHLDLANL